MLEFTTESGAKYTFDTDNRRLLRHGPNSRGIDYENVPDDMWHEVIDTPVLEVGKSAQFLLGQGKWRITTRVVDIEEV